MRGYQTFLYVALCPLSVCAQQYNVNTFLPHPSFLPLSLAPFFGVLLLPPSLPPFFALFVPSSCLPYLSPHLIITSTLLPSLNFPLSVSLLLLYLSPSLMQELCLLSTQEITEEIGGGSILCHACRSPVIVCGTCMYTASFLILCSSMGKWLLAVSEP